MMTTLRALAVATLAGAVLLVGGPVAAQVADIEAIADEVDASGRYLEREVDTAAVAAIDRANADGVAFVRLDTPQDGASVAQELAVELASRDSRYGAVIVLTNNSVYANGVPEALNAVPPDVTNLFGTGQIAQGIDAVVDNLDGAARGGDPRNTGSNGGGAFSWILVVILAVGAFFLFNMIRGRRKTKKVETTAIEADRAEIKEQLKANADRVIDLGDEVIASKDAKLIALYEEASRAYQNVSNEIDNARTAAEVDALDDQIDKAEWQFEVIEAKLAGAPPPPFVDDDEPQTPPPPAPPPAVSPAERDAQLRRGQPPRPLPRRNPRTRSSSRDGGLGGMLGGTFGRMAMSVLLSMLMGGRLGRPRMSRRSSRRGGYGGFGPVL